MAQGKKIPSEEIAKNLKETGGNVSATARRMNVSREGINSHIAKEPELKRLTESEREGIVDVAEYGLKYLLNDREHKDFFGAVKYTLSTLGKNRGYTERQEVDVSGMTVIVRQRDTKL